MSYLVFKADDNEKGGVHALCVEIWRDWTLYPVRVLDNTVLTSVNVCADKWTVVHHDVIKNYDARIVVAVPDSKGSCRPHFIGPAPEARHFYPKEAVTKTGPHERVTARPWPSS